MSYQQEPNAQGLWVAAKAGGCRTGSDGGGTVYHVLEATPTAYGRSLCGDRPAIQWSSWLPEGQQVTCPRCIKKLAKRGATRV